MFKNVEEKQMTDLMRGSFPARLAFAPIVGIALILAIVVATLAGLGTPAASAATPSALMRVPEGGKIGSGAGELFRPTAIATDPHTGHVFIADRSNSRVSEFTSWGVFVKAWGWGVEDGAEEFQVCTSVCQAGRPGSGPGQFDLLNGIAIDPEGYVYVSDEANNRVQKFNLSGQFVRMFGREVNTTTGEDVCTQTQVESGDECGAGVEGETSGAFSRAGTITVASDGTVWVANFHSLQHYSADGSFLSMIADPESMPISVALDPDDNLYVSFFQKDRIFHLTPFGEPAGPAIETPGDARHLATDVVGNIYAVVDPDPGFGNPEFEARVMQFDAAGDCIICFEDAFLLGNIGPGPDDKGPFALATNVRSDGSDEPGNLYVTTFGARVSYFEAFGPRPEFEEAPESAPVIASQFAATVGFDRAEVKAEINPRFFRGTTYYVEYGTADCGSSECAQQPLSPGLPLGAELNVPEATAPVALTKLAPGTTYHYRFVSKSGTFTTVGPDSTFTTYRAAARSLLDGRQYELVSPPDKNSAEVGIPSLPFEQRGSSGASNLTAEILQASPDGERITYTSFTAFGEFPQSAPSASQYLSTRAAGGWSTANVTPPNEEGFTKAPVRGVSTNLDALALVVRQPSLAEEASEGVDNLYVQDLLSGSVRLVTNTPPRLSIPGPEYCVAFGGEAERFGKTIFAAKGALTADSPLPGQGYNLYEWTPEEGIRLLSILPSGSPAKPNGGTGFGAGLEGQCGKGTRIAWNAISDDGSRVFWTYGTDGGGQLMARVNGNSTVQLDAPQGVGGKGGGGMYYGASADGSAVVFTSEAKLVPGANAGDLYRYDFAAAPGQRLVDLTVSASPAAVQGVVGISNDAASIYFVASGALGAEGTAGATNLYLWRGGEIRFVATLGSKGLASAGGDEATWSEDPRYRVGRVTPSGDALAFASTAAVTGADNIGQSTGAATTQVFLYDALTDTLTCASCNPTGARPLGRGKLPGSSNPIEQPRFLSEDGSRLFFNSFDSLDPRDSNGKRDVYEFERVGTGDCTTASPHLSQVSGGCVALISSGGSADDSYFVDASRDGRDVFFSTSEGLVPWDEDGRYDIYDARGGGGFPPPPAAPRECEGEGCRPSTSPPPVAIPGSSAFSGPGNATCPKPHRACGKPKRPCRKHPKRCGKPCKKHGKPCKKHNNRGASKGSRSGRSAAANEDRRSY
jgi:hypothetical protein